MDHTNAELTETPEDDLVKEFGNFRRALSKRYTDYRRGHEEYMEYMLPLAIAYYGILRGETILRRTLDIPSELRAPAWVLMVLDESETNKKEWYER